VDGVGAQVGVVLHALLDEAGERGQHERVVDALLVHDLEPRRGLTEPGRAVDPPPDDLAL
jgi:hypothetical protein